MAPFPERRANRSRVKDASALWICCCCGCLPVVGLLKALVFAPWPVLILCVGCTLTSLVCLFHDIILGYQIVWTTTLLGRNIRVVLLLTLPVLLVIWPFVVLLLTLLGGLFYFFGVIYGSVFDDDIPLLGGWWTPMRDSASWVRLWWRHNCEGVFDLAAHIRGIPRGWDGQVYDIPLINLFLSVGLIAWGSVMGGVGIVILATLKLVPAILRTFYEYFSLLQDLQPWWWLFWFCGLSFVVVACPLVYGLVICYGFASGPRCAIEALTSDSLASGFLEVMRILREFDLASNVFILRRESSCVPKVRARPLRQGISDLFVNRPEESLKEVWDVFFQECERTTRQAVADDWILLGSLEALDPALIIGAPALCVFDTLHKSALEAPGVPSICWPASKCEEKTRPRNSIADTFWPKLMACKAEISRHHPLSEEELLYLRVKLCAGGGETDALGHGARTVLARECTRQRELHGICAEVTRLSLELSRLGEMQRRFPSMVAAITGNTVHASDEPQPQMLGRTGGGSDVDDPQFQQFVMAMALAAALDVENGGPNGSGAGGEDVDLPGFVQS
mmetsp:Transcript_10777/g.33646  ORF Transcript_10777/g.33646 Transcript_10777/m.33646 type:complete len:564 (+) Transcript_10777:150-1841(+)